MSGSMRLDAPRLPGSGPRPAELDPWLLWPAVALLLIGLVMVYSASIAVADSSRFTGNRPDFFLIRQAVFLAIGGVAALMAFQVRDARGAALWAGGSLRRPDGTVARFAPADVRFGAERIWRSPSTGGRYPVERSLTVRLPEGERRWNLKPLFDDQELDSRAAGGPIYWEGAVSAPGAKGCLELTGYVSPMKL